MMQMTDDEYGEHLDYDDGYHDGVNGERRKTWGFHRSEEKYKSGFSIGRERLRKSFAQMLANDFGVEAQKQPELKHPLGAS